MGPMFVLIAVLAFAQPFVPPTVAYRQCAPVLVNVRHGLTTSHLLSLKSPSQIQQQQQSAFLGCFVKEKDNDQ
jgi:hypothetical protein